MRAARHHTKSMRSLGDHELSCTNTFKQDFIAKENLSASWEFCTQDFAAMHNFADVCCMLHKMQTACIFSTDLYISPPSFTVFFFVTHHKMQLPPILTITGEASIPQNPQLAPLPQMVPSPQRLPSLQQLLPNHVLPSQAPQPIRLSCECCGCESTPEWRRGPNGARTLCNACGLYFAKVSKRRGPAHAIEEMKKKQAIRQQRQNLAPPAPSLNKYQGELTYGRCYNGYAPY